MKMHFGIDYGAKLSGNTVICYNHKEKLHLIQSEKKQDSDLFLSQKIDELNPSVIYFDAPLSIPAAYFGKGDNFHYRKCDTETSAMSPMFLGGLTARAMKLRSKHNSIPFFETYPSYFIREVAKAKEIYKKKEKLVNQDLLNLLQTYTKLPLPVAIDNYHQVDAVICWLSGIRHINNTHIVLGDESEGLIIV